MSCFVNSFWHVENSGFVLWNFLYFFFLIGDWFNIEPMDMEG